MNVLAEHDSMANPAPERRTQSAGVGIEHSIPPARQLRAEVLDDTLRGVVGAILRETGLAALTGALLRAHGQRRTAAELNRLDDALLRDIGVQRGDIPYIAEQAVAPKRPAASQRPNWLVRRRQARLRRAIAGQLEVLPDWALEDIGIPRHEIAAVAARMAAQQIAAKDRTVPEIRVTEPASAAPARISPVHDLVHQLEAAVRPLRQWQMSRVAANQMARFDPDMLADLGYVKGDVDWVPEVLTQRRLDQPANQDGQHAGAA